LVKAKDKYALNQQCEEQSTSERTITVLGGFGMTMTAFSLAFSTKKRRTSNRRKTFVPRILIPSDKMFFSSRALKNTSENPRHLPVL
jgi:hypothetical protein